MPESTLLNSLPAPTRRLWLYGVAIIAVPLLVQIILISVLHWQVASVEKQLGQLQTENSISQRAGSIEKSVQDIYLLLIIYSASKSEFALERLHLAAENINQELKVIKSLRHSGNTALIKELENRLEPVLQRVKKVEAAINSESDLFNQLPHLYAEIALTHNLTKSGLDKFQKAQFDLQSRLEKERAERTRTLEATLAIGLFLSISTSLLVAFLVAGFFNRRLQVVVNNALRIARGQPLLPPLSGFDEISHLDATIRTMALALAQAETRERDLIDNSNDLICSIDQTGSITEISPSASNILGVEPEELRGLRFINLIDPEYKPIANDALWQGKQTARPFLFETRLADAAPYCREIAWSARWNKDKQMYFLVGHDITERKQAERMKQELIGMVTHDIRTPLMTVDANLQMLEAFVQGQNDQRVEAVLKRARKAGDQVLNLAQDFLELDKLDSGMTVLNFENADIQMILSEAVDLAAGATQEKSLKYTIKGFPGQCSCDRRRIVQILVNLLSNAAKFSAAGGEITLSASASREKVTFSVQDKGPGIPRDLLPHVFDRYRQTHKEKAGKIGGTGLGLSICQSLVRLHGGEIWVESKEGEGSIFGFWIPR